MPKNQILEQLNEIEKILIKGLVGETIKNAFKDNEDNLVLELSSDQMVSVNYCCYGGVIVAQKRQQTAWIM